MLFQDQNGASNEIRIDSKVLMVGDERQMFEFKADESPTITSISPLSGWFLSV